MIYAYEFVFLNQLKAFWADVAAKVGTPDDYIPKIFKQLPADGDFQANHKAIGELVTRMSSGDPINDLTFLLEFPTVKPQFPCLFIETGAEQEEEVIGGVVSEEFDEDTDMWEMERGGPFFKQYRIGVFSFFPDSTLYLYSIFKYGLLLLRDNLGDAANFLIQGEKMQQDYQRFHPDIVYFRYFNITVEGVLDTAVETANKITTIDVEVSEG